jgi:hypothetical protein
VLAEEDSGYKELTKRKTAEDERLGMSALKHLCDSIQTIYTAQDKEKQAPTGNIVSFERAVFNHASAVGREKEERSKASQAVFNDVWTSATKVFEDKNINFENCPVCDTAFVSSTHGSRENVLSGLKVKLTDLAAYRAAEGNLRTATKTLEGTLRDTKSGLTTAISSLDGAGYRNKAKWTVAYLDKLKVWKIGDQTPASDDAVMELTALTSLLTEKRQHIEMQQGENTYANALEIVSQLIKIKSRLKRIQCAKTELLTLHEELNRQALVINKKIVEHIQNLIGKLQHGMDILYSGIQGEEGNAPPIRFDLPGENDANQQCIQLLIDFADNRKDVIPSGYFSDSQIHTLALALRLSAIRIFNTGVPIIVLDDVVTSYDADHRKNIAALLAKHFTDFQIILVTHDEQFFNLLQDHLSQATWLFRRIIKIEPKFGPIFHDHRTPDKIIQDKLDSNESAAVEMRQAEEEWLLDICRGFGVKVVIRSVDRPYQFERSELADSLASFLKGAHILPPEVPGISNTFLTSLQKGVIENFSTHFSDNPYKSCSVGDERARWKEFQFFRDQFACHSCGKQRFKRPPSLSKPVCFHCETSFSFLAHKET